MGQDPGVDQKPRGSEDTRTFYDQKGWQTVNGVLVDKVLFGARGDGPIRRAAHEARTSRLLAHLESAGPPLRLLECGCGGNPELKLLPICSHYTGADFSTKGLEVARERLSRQSVPFDLVNTDICNLPFADASFDAVYSAHAIYHIPTEAGQDAAFCEIARVLKPRGVAVFVLVNPFPLLFPTRSARRALAATPVIRQVLDRVRPKPPLPYQPASLGWMRRCLSRFGDVLIESHAIASNSFERNVSENGSLGKLAWQGIYYAERAHPRASASLGNYVQIVLRRR